MVRMEIKITMWVIAGVKRAHLVRLRFVRVCAKRSGFAELSRPANDEPGCVAWLFTTNVKLVPGVVLDECLAAALLSIELPDSSVS